ncbi:MAG: hemerythrin [Nitrospirae bacterium RBG_19FT_COMBO_42_15]|nr:MAG: hemerythrin [Nitrospirae bacterium RBG_19FT_COMBO_42_15]
MPIQWTEELSIGSKEIDNQHKELFNRINQLLDACNKGEGKEIASKMLNFLEDYIVIHFTAEENIQKKYNYPEYEAHKLLHLKFIKDFSALKKNFDAEGPSLPIVLQINRIVVDWLINHIKKVDKALGKFVKTKL